MPSAAYLFITDHQGKSIKSAVKIQGREDSAEVHTFDYHVSVPSDRNSGILMGVREHSEVVLGKQFDAASPVLFNICCRGVTLQKLRLEWFKINPTGKEENYFTHIFSNVNIVKYRQHMQHVKDAAFKHHGHQEEVSLRFQKIEMLYPNGNISAADDWLENRSSEA